MVDASGTFSAFSVAAFSASPETALDVSLNSEAEGGRET